MASGWDQDFQLKSQYEISQEIFYTIFVSKFFVNQDFLRIFEIFPGLFFENPRFVDY